MPGGKAARDKGLNGEREFVKLMGGERIPLSGAAGGSFTGDVANVPYLGRGEIKRRKGGWLQIYHWIENNDFLGIRSDRKEWLVVMRAEDLRKITEEMDELKRAANK